MQAIVKIGGSQYLITEGQEFLVDLQKATDTMVIDQVLLLADGDKVQVGQPFVSGVQVSCEVLGMVKGDKVRTSKYKAKSRYRKTVGFRPKHTKLKVVSIGTSVNAVEKVAAPQPKKTRETKA